MANKKVVKALCYRFRVQGIEIKCDESYEGKEFEQRPTRTHITLEFDGPPKDYREGRRSMPYGIAIIDAFAGIWDIKDVTAQVKLGDKFELRQLSDNEKDN